MIIKIADQSSTIIQVPQYVSFANRADSASFAETAAFALSSLGSIESASYATFAASSTWTGISSIPVGIISSSTQFNALTNTSASYALQAGNAQTAVSASWAPGVGESTLWSSIVGIPSGLVSSSVQVNAILDADNVVSSSAQVSYTGLSNVPSGIISSSAQVNAILDADNIISSSVQVQFNSISGRPSGLVSSSAQVDYTGIQNKPTLVPSASYAAFAQSSLSASWAPGMDASSAWNDITGKPDGLVSSSVQATDWSVASASLAQNAISASYFLVSSSRFVPVASDGTLPGSIYYSSTRQALVYVTDDDSAIDIGFALHSRVYNATGVNIPKGTVLQYDGVFASGRVRVRPAIAPNINAPHPTIIGVAHEAIPNGEFGDAISEGILYNTNTAGFTEGNQLYLSTTASGSLTETAPGNEFHRISVATCVITQPSTGRLFVRVEQYCPPNWNRLFNKPDGLVSSSAQIAYSGISGVPSGILSSSVQFNALTNTSASYALQAGNAQTAVSASWAPSTEGAPTAWDSVTNKPAGLVSSSAQIAYSGISGVPSGIISSSAQVNAILDADGVISSSAQVNFTGISNRPSGLVSSSAQVSYPQLANIPVGIVSSSAQAATWTVATASVALNSPTLPAGLVSSSAQINYTGLSNIPTGIVSSSAQATGWTVASSSVATSASWAAVAVSASWAPGVGGSTLWTSISGIPVGLVSSSVQINYSGISNVPSGIISSSAQVNTILDADGVISSSAQVQFDSIGGRPSGLVSSSAQVSFPQLANIPSGLVSSSVQVAFSGITGVPSGLLSSSAQVNAILDADNVVSSSAQISFAGITGVPSGLLSSSAQVNAILDADGVISSSAQISYLGLSNVPTGIVSSSAQAATWTVASASVSTTSSYAIVAQNVLGSITSASYALTASYAMNGGGGGSPFDLGVARTGSIAGNNISVLNFTGGAIQGISITGTTASISISAGVADSASFATSASFAVSASWAPSTGGGNPIAVQDEGTEIVASPIAINFTGAGVLVTAVGATASVSIPGGAGNTTVRFVSASTNIQTSDKFLIATSGLVTMSLPSANTLSGTEFTIQNTGAQQIFLSPSGSNTINGYPFFVIEHINSSLTLTSVGSSGWIVG